MCLFSIQFGICACLERDSAVASVLRGNVELLPSKLTLCSCLQRPVHCAVRSAFVTKTIHVHESHASLRAQLATLPDPFVDGGTSSAPERGVGRLSRTLRPATPRHAATRHPQPPPKTSTGHRRIRPSQGGRHNAHTTDPPVDDAATLILTDHSEHYAALHHRRHPAAAVSASPPAAGTCGWHLQLAGSQLSPGAVQHVITPRAGLEPGAGRASRRAGVVPSQIATGLGLLNGKSPLWGHLI